MCLLNPVFSEVNMNISKQNKQNNIDYMCSEIKHIIVEYGDRDPGSKGESAALEHMAQELEKVSDSVVKETFDVHPHAFMGWTWFTATFLILGTLLSVLSPIAGFIGLILAVLPIITQFVFYGSALDFLFKKKQSGNVYAVKRPQGEIKRRIILNGHSDAAYEWHWLQAGGFKAFLISIIIPIVGLFFLLGMCIAATAVTGILGRLTGSMRYVWYASLIFIPAYICFYFFSNNTRPVPGANDNLTACYMSIGAMKLLQDSGINLEHTELCTLITGSEEAGLRGAKAWSKRHKDVDKDVETIFITYETLRELNHLHIYDRDLNGLVKNDAQVSELVKLAGSKNGMNLTCGCVFCGSTDAAAFSLAGFKATAIAAMDPNLKCYYHTREDNFNNLSRPCLEKVLDITLDMLETYDKDGLPK